MNKLILVCFSVVLCAAPVSSFAVFFQTKTMRQHCEEYVKFVELQAPVNHYEAGVCAGYISSKIEVMELSGRLCNKDKINLTQVAREYVEKTEAHQQDESSAAFMLVELLDQNYACR